MNQERYHYILLYGHRGGNRPRDKTNKKWLDDVKEDCSDLGINLCEATQVIENGGYWRCTFGLPVFNNLSPKQ